MMSILTPEQRRQIIIKRVLIKTYDIMGKNGMAAILKRVENNIKEELASIEANAVDLFFKDKEEKLHGLAIEDIFEKGEFKKDEKGELTAELTDFIKEKQSLQKFIIDESLKDPIFGKAVKIAIGNIGYIQGKKLKADTLEDARKNLESLFQKNEVDYNIKGLFNVDNELIDEDEVLEKGGVIKEPVGLKITLNKCPWGETHLCAYTENLAKGMVAGKNYSAGFVGETIYEGGKNCVICINPKKS